MTGPMSGSTANAVAAADEPGAAQPPPGVSVRPPDQRQPDGDAEHDQRDQDAAGDVAGDVDREHEARRLVGLLATGGRPARPTGARRSDCARRRPAAPRPDGAFRTFAALLEPGGQTGSLLYAPRNAGSWYAREHGRAAGKRTGRSIVNIRELDEESRRTGVWPPRRIILRVEPQEGDDDATADGRAAAVKVGEVDLSAPPSAPPKPRAAPAPLPAPSLSPSVTPSRRRGLPGSRGVTPAPTVSTEDAAFDKWLAEPLPDADAEPEYQPPPAWLPADVRVRAERRHRRVARKARTQLFGASAATTLAIGGCAAALAHRPLADRVRRRLARRAFDRRLRNGPQEPPQQGCGERRRKRAGEQRAPAAGEADRVGRRDAAHAVARGARELGGVFGTGGGVGAVAPAHRAPVVTGRPRPRAAPRTRRRRRRRRPGARAQARGRAGTRGRLERPVLQAGDLAPCRRGRCRPRHRDRRRAAPTNQLTRAVARDRAGRPRRAGASALA